MTETLLVLAGLVGGAGVAWLVARGYLRAAVLAEREALGARLSGAEALGDEVRKQLTQREIDLAHARASLDRERTQRVEAEVRWEAERLALEEQRRQLAAVQTRFGETFKALSAEALRESNAAFLGLAGERLENQLERRQQEIDGLVRPLREALERYEVHGRELEASRQRAYGSLEEQVRALAASSAELQRETGNLVTALRAPQVRGRWGEITLHRVVELAGMTEHCDYVEQVTVEGEGGRIRPDMIVRLPAGREIVVDAKVPLAAYLDAVNARGPEERSVALARHAQQMRQHMTALGAKAYWEEFGKAAELVVMFIPGEAFVAAAAEADGTLIEDGMARRVVVATPSTLIALLRAIAYGWRQERIAENAERLRTLGQELYERMRVMMGHLDDAGDKLGKAVAAYNKAVGSLEARVLPAARRFRDLGAGGGVEIPALEGIDEQARGIEAPELPRQLDTPEVAP